MSTTIKLRYSSMKNISFKGEVDTRIDKEEWAEMPPAEQASIIYEFLNDLVEIWVIGE